LADAEVRLNREPHQGAIDPSKQQRNEGEWALRVRAITWSFVRIRG